MPYQRVLVLVFLAIGAVWLTSVADNPYSDFVTPKCIADPTKCAAAELCLIAAVGDTGNKRWSTSAERQGHVLQAKRLGLKCGV